MPETLPDMPSAVAGSPARTRAILVATLFVIMLGVGGWWAGRNLGANAVPVRTTVAGERLFDQVLAAVSQKFVDSLEMSTIYDKSISGLIRELHDPYTAFLSADRLSKLGEQISGVYAGVGLQVDIRDNWPTVIEPIAGGPAELAGVQAGDRIVMINEESAEGMTQQEYSRALRGPPGSDVSFTVERGEQRIQFTIQRASVHRRAVPRVAILPGGVGYADVKVFSAQTAAELAEAVDSLVRQGARSLVIDLRGNPGGLLEQGVAVSELFLNPGQAIVQLRARPGTEAQTFSDTASQRWPGLPLAVLVDQGSASSSEIVAGALQDHDRALVLGTTSYGKGSAQSVFPLVSGEGLRLTTARWYTPVGRSISKAAPAVDDGYDANPIRIPGQADTTRPTFKTDMGRVVLGGGGITPDVIAGDSITPFAVQALARAMGKDLGAYRDALAKLSLSLKRAGVVKSRDEPVTRDMLDALYRDLESRKVAPDRRIFDSASPWIARALGYEMTRVAFGPDAEFARRAQDDVALQRASTLLQRARTPREVFAGLEGGPVEVRAAPH